MRFYDRRVIFRALLLATSLYAYGCATKYAVDVNSVAKPDANTISYVLHDANPEEREDTLRFREAANLVRTALSGRGMFEAPPKVVPDVIVSIDYGVSAAQVHEEKRTRPASKVIPASLSSEGIWTPAQTVLDERREETVIVRRTTHEKYLILTARENLSPQESRVPAEIWKVDVTTDGESSDLRKHLPILVAASIDYMGQDSKGKKTIRLQDSDSDVVFVKKGL